MFGSPCDGAHGFEKVAISDTGTVGAKGRVDAEGDADLAGHRRPADFGRAASNQPIAAADPWRQRQLAHSLRRIAYCIVSS
ncbi:hypothetical protein M673_20275 (plasmid) [Aureimonas sp. AU20]|nr:hypothetical protein M673_20275 [Aureimonas sp. AU20]